MGNLFRKSDGTLANKSGHLNSNDSSTNCCCDCGCREVSACNELAIPSSVQVDCSVSYPFATGCKGPCYSPLPTDTKGETCNSAYPGIFNGSSIGTPQYWPADQIMAVGGCDGKPCKCPDYIKLSLSGQKVTFTAATNIQLCCSDGHGGDWDGFGDDCVWDQILASTQDVSMDGDYYVPFEGFTPVEGTSFGCSYCGIFPAPLLPQYWFQPRDPFCNCCDHSCADYFCNTTTCSCLGDVIFDYPLASFLLIQIDIADGPFMPDGTQAAGGVTDIFIWHYSLWPSSSDGLTKPWTGTWNWTPLSSNMFFSWGTSGAGALNPAAFQPCWTDSATVSNYYQDKIIGGGFYQGYGGTATLTPIWGSAPGSTPPAGCFGNSCYSLFQCTYSVATHSWGSVSLLASGCGPYPYGGGNWSKYSVDCTAETLTYAYMVVGDSCDPNSPSCPTQTPPPPPTFTPNFCHYCNCGSCIYHLQVTYDRTAGSFNTPTIVGHTCGGTVPSYTWIQTDCNTWETWVIDSSGGCLSNGDCNKTFSELKSTPFVHIPNLPKPTCLPTCAGCVYRIAQDVPCIGNDYAPRQSVVEVFCGTPAINDWQYQGCYGDGQCWQRWIIDVPACTTCAVDADCSGTMPSWLEVPSFPFSTDPLDCSACAGCYYLITAVWTSLDCVTGTWEYSATKNCGIIPDTLRTWQESCGFYCDTNTTVVSYAIAIPACHDCGGDCPVLDVSGGLPSGLPPLPDYSGDCAACFELKHPLCPSSGDGMGGL